MDQLVDVINIYDKDGDDFLDQNELAELEKDVEYTFTEKERELFNLSNEKISLDNVIMALSYQENNVNEEMYKKYMIQLLDPTNQGKVFVPALINLLKKSGEIRLDEIKELVSNLELDEGHYWKYK